MPVRYLVALLLTASALAQPLVTTVQYDNSRTGANLQEAVLTPRNVNSKQFGNLFILPVDGDVYAQPLFVSNQEIPGQGRHNVLLVATEHDSVYAFDAAGEPATPLWHSSFVNPAKGIRPVPEAAVSNAAPRRTP